MFEDLSQAFIAIFNGLHNANRLEDECDLGFLYLLGPWHRIAPQRRTLWP